MKHVFFLIATIIKFNFAYSQEPTSTYIEKKTQQITPTYNFIFDKHSSAFVGVSLINNIFDAYTNILPYSQKTTDSSTKILLRSLRFTTDLWLSLALLVVKHEVFGHGARYREFGWGPSHYNIYPKYLKIFFGGSASHKYIYGNDLQHELDNKTFYIRNIVGTIGGIESSDVMANIAALKAIDKKKLPLNYSVEYFSGVFDQIFYITRTTDTSEPNNDIKQYIKGINIIYEQDKKNATETLLGEVYSNRDFIPKSRVINLEDTKKSVILSFLDPFLYLSIFNIGSYIKEASTSLDIPMINLGKIKFLPRFRLVLSPFGLDNQLNNYIVFDKYSGVLSLSYGKTANKDYLTLGIETNYTQINNWLKLALKSYIWRQPELYSSFMRSSVQKNGFLLTIKSKIKLREHFGSSLELGYKTRGYIQGEILDYGLIARAGMYINF